MTVFVSDLDGTLLSSDRTVSEFTRNTITQLRAPQQLIVATGRPPRLVMAFKEHLPGVRTVVCANGAFSVDFTTGLVSQHGAISEAAARRIVNQIQAANASARFAVETSTGHRRERTYPSTYDVPDRLKGSITEILTGGVAKMLIRFDDPVSRKGAERLQATVGDLGLITVSNPEFYELAPPGVSKATGLAALGIRGDTVAYGDMPNDISLLEWADLGVAVANADEQVLQVADCVLDQTNDEDAVAHHMLTRLAYRLL